MLGPAVLLFLVLFSWTAFAGGQLPGFEKFSCEVCYFLAPSGRTRSVPT